MLCKKKGDLEETKQSISGGTKPWKQGRSSTRRKNEGKGRKEKRNRNPKRGVKGKGNDFLNSETFEDKLRDLCQRMTRPERKKH
jgi:hypothetical protein